MSDSIWRFISTSVSSSRAASVKSPCCWHKTCRYRKKGATPKECAPLRKPAIRLSPLTPCENETTLNAGSRKIRTPDHLSNKAAIASTQLINKIENEEFAKFKNLKRIYIFRRRT